MSIVTIVLFFIYLWGLGFTLTTFTKNSQNFLERNLMRVGIGLGMFPILSIILNFLHIPLDWKIFLLISLSCPLVCLILKIKKKEIKFTLKFRLKRSTIPILFVLILFSLTFFMYHKGAFAYPYFEDGDPWGHSLGIKYISIEKTAFEPLEGEDIFTYISPYPPGYGILMGVLHQTSSSIKWTLKFFNALIISLGIIFFYFFAKELIGNRNKALFSTFVFAAIPCYLSHFIWAHSLIITLFFPTMYCLERIKYDKKWLFPSLTVYSGMMLVQPSQSVKLSIMLGMYILLKSIMENKIQKEAFYSLAGGFILSLVWWVANWREMFLRGSGYIAGKNVTMVQETIQKTNVINTILNAFPPDSGSATRPFTFADFFVAKTQNMINNPIGIGIAISLLLGVSLFYVLFKYKRLLEKENQWIIITLFWLIFTFLGVNSMTFNLPVGLFAFRFWALFAIPIALICSEGAWFLAGVGKKVNIPVSLMFLLIVIGIMFTSAVQKYAVNTSVWPTDGSFSGGQPSEPFEYAKWFSTLPPNTKVFLYAPRGKLTIGFDAYSCEWCKDVIDFREDILNKNVTQLHDFLKSRRYEYLIFGRMDFKYLAEDDKSKEILQNRINEAASSALFRPVHQVEGVMIVLRIL